MTITDVSAVLGVPRPNLPNIINEKAAISPEMAVKLFESFGNSTQSWVNLQKNYEVWQAEKKVDRANIQHFWPGGTDLQPI